MQHTGHTILQPSQYASYEAFKATVNGNGYDWDSSYGDQCWDGCQLLYGQYGKWLATGPNGSAYECWTVSKDVNATEPFEAISDKTQIKKGDIVVFSNNQFPPYGHIAYADEDYHDGNMRFLGQNQGGTPYVGGGAFFNITSLSTANILGAFRNTNWNDSPAPTPGSTIKTSFPWVLYARKIRQRNNLQ